MKWFRYVLWMAMASLIFSCVDNEQTFYIEHVKVSPDPPDCSYSTGDKVTSGYSLNLFNAATPYAAFYFTNALMSRKDHGTLKAESNGIFVDGYEVYTLIPGRGAVVGTEFFDYNHYIGPESSDVVIADIMSTQTIEMLRTSFGCNSYHPATIAQAVLSGDTAILSDLRRMDQRHFGGVGGEPMPPVMYAVVKFLGHTQGGKRVETQEFTIRLQTFCGVAGGWEPCLNRETICGIANSEYKEACSEGLDQLMNCREYISLIDKTFENHSSCTPTP